MSDPQIPASGAPSEPLLTVGVLGTLATAVIAGVVAFFTPVSNDQRAAILGLVAVLAPFLVALVGRAKAWSPASVRALVLQVKADANAAKRSMPFTPTTDVRDAP